MNRLPEAPDVRRLLYHIGLDLSMTVLAGRSLTERHVGARHSVGQRVARELLDGIRRGKHLIVPGLESKLISRLQGLSSSLVDWYMDGVIAKAQARKAEGRA